MEITKVQPGMTGVNIKGKVLEIGKIRDVKTRYGETQVANATLEDESGQVKLTLWGDQIEKVSEGKVVEVVNGYANEWQGEIQISVGKRGEIKISDE